MNKLDQIQDLINKLNYYIKMYDEGTPVISDKEYDDLYFQLEKLEKETGVYMANSPTTHIDYFSLNELKKVIHSHPMLSLDKTKSIQDVLNFIGDQDIIAMLKMDGLTCSLRYEDGTLVSAETRGNGEVGEDITHNIITVKGVPIEIPFKQTLVVDGEVICTYQDFEKVSDKYANPRNYAAGSIRLLNNGECANRNLTFVAWDCIDGLNDLAVLSEKLIKLKWFGFTIVPFISGENLNIEQTINELKELGNSNFYPYDGLVFKYENCSLYANLGITSHHPKAALAFKFYDEEYETYLRNIEWSMGKTGQLTPIAIFDDVETDDSIVNRASLHNLSIMKQILGRPYCRQKIKMFKANMIIPQISWGEKSDEDLLWYLDPPNECPICGKSTIIKDDFLYCSNPNCEGKLINRLDHFVGKKGLDIKGLSKATLQKLINWEWVNSITDIFNLYHYKNEWYKKDGFGVKSVDNILTAIENSKECEMWQFISALSIPLIGSTYAKEISRQCASWLQFMECVGPHMLEEYDFTQWDGFGYEMNKSLHSFDYTEANELVNNILHLKNSLWKNLEEKIEENNLTGKNLCVTGKLYKFKNRDELVAAVEAVGGKVTSTISSKTNYLVTNDTESGSSKNIKAKSLGIPIITEDQLLALL